MANEITIEAVREIRCNIAAMAELIKAIEVSEIETLEFRINDIESCLLGESEEKGLMQMVKGLDINQDDHEERLNLLETRIGDEDVWDMLESNDELPDYSYGETLLGALRELTDRVEKLEARYNLISARYK